ncbi:MAG: rhodanese-like domain-containing protein [Dethiosulfatibacter sp.]|nr:rhodanese-like domain-containing protein [Dethiosulfatibacter sp.]
MKRILMIILIIILLTAGCTAPTPVTTLQSSPVESSEKAEYIKISAQKAKEIIDTGADILIVDVRTEEEFKQGHIPNAILIPDTQIRDLAADMLVDLDQTILIYCRSGNRSRTASKILIDMGYTNVMDFGGILDWPYEIVK